MSKIKTELLARKTQIQKQLKEYDELVLELSEVNKALAALESPRCDSETNGRCYGCSVCRGGPNYR